MGAFVYQVKSVLSYFIFSWRNEITEYTEYDKDDISKNIRFNFRVFRDFRARSNSPEHLHLHQLLIHTILCQQFIVGSLFYNCSVINHHN